MNKKNKGIIPGAEPFHLKGEGKRILLIHGFTATVTEVRPVGEYLHQYGYDVYSVLLAGHGRTPEALHKSTRHDWWESAKKAFESIDNCEFVLGLSMGGLLASRLAVEYEKQLQALILLATPMGLASKLAKLVPFFKYFMRYIDKSPESEEYFQQHHLISYLKYPTTATHELLKLIKFTKKKIIPKITIPTLICQGEKDDSILPESYEIIRKIISSSELQVTLFPNSKHIITVEPDQMELLKTIHHFLEKQT
jgi:carboxylesterase